MEKIYSYKNKKQFGNKITLYNNKKNFLCVIEDRNNKSYFIISSDQTRLYCINSLIKNKKIEIDNIDNRYIEINLDEIGFSPLPIEIKNIFDDNDLDII